MANFTELKNRSTEIRQEVGVGKNTAKRIGQLFLDILSWASNLFLELTTEIQKRVTHQQLKDAVGVEEKRAKTVEEALSLSKADKDLSNVPDGTITENILSEEVRLKLNTSTGGGDLTNYYTKAQTDTAIRRSEESVREDLSVIVEELERGIDLRAKKTDVYTKAETDEKLIYGQNNVVTNPIGDFEYGDLLKDMFLEEIITKMLCPDVGMLKPPGIASLSIDDSMLPATGEITITVNRTPGGIPSHYAVAESVEALTNWIDYASSFVYKFDSYGQKTVYVNLKNSAGQSGAASATVNYEEIFYTITPLLGNGYSIAPSQATTVKAGDSYSLTIKASTGYILTGIHIDGTSFPVSAQTYIYEFKSISSNHTISAVVTQAVTIRTIVNNSSWGTVDEEKVVIAQSSTTITAVPAEGYEVSRWAIAADDHTIQTGGNTLTVNTGTDDLAFKVYFKAFVTSSMYMGYLEAGDLSNANEVVSNGFASIKGSDVLAAPNITSYTLGAKTLEIYPTVGSVMFFTVLGSSTYKIMKDDGFGGHVAFSSGSGSTVLVANGEKEIQINGVSYRVYGEDANVAGKRTIYIEQK